ncbi:MAG: hypothetical protein EP305_05525 [Bacteroidetes bacterium]|nr:MAG: hypothetical protein EP305_05525 [Bacteroidota bacterium]
MKKEKFKDKLVSYFSRCSEDTPPFFKKLRKVGLMVAAAGTAVVAAPVALPAVVITIGGYLIVGGAVASAVSQAAIDSSVNDGIEK